MLLNQIVEVNQTGVLRSSVNFGMMDNPEINRDLSAGFIFNYDHQRPEQSTVGILDRLRRSFHSRTEPNIHLLVQQYGKGKSHFAVAIANYFQQPYDSPEVQGILQQIENAVAGKSSGLVEGLRTFKQQQRRGFLVVCLSGDRGGDLNQQFLKAALKALGNEAQQAIAHHICGRPLAYLERLTADQRQQADDYLERINCPEGDVQALIELLRNNDSSVVRTVKDISDHLNEGFPIDFQTNLNIEDILKDLIDNLCSGETAIFQGILILFDELGYYLKLWAANEIAAGGTAIQNITNICETYKGKIALLSFTQVNLNNTTGISANSMQSYRKISTRLAPTDTTYEPISSLELVLDSLLVEKDTPDRQRFQTRWNDTLLAEARAVYDTYTPFYKERGWPLERFYRHLSLGCFPLHPITAYLLANLSFSQDRSAIQFLRGDVSRIINQEPVVRDERLNYIYPIQLVDSFLESFSDQSDYQAYRDAYASAVNADNPDELLTLKALFLYHASSDKLAKRDQQPHEEILARLSGLQATRLRTALTSLKEQRRLIHYQSATKTYLFFRVNPNALEEEIEDEIQDQPSTLQSVVEYSQERVTRFLGNPKLPASEFVRQNDLVTDDWQFEHKFYTIDGLKRALSSDQTLRGTNERGIMAYVLAQTPEELQEFRATVDEELRRSPIGQQIAVAIPTEATGNLDRTLLKKITLESKDSRKRSDAYTQLVEHWEKDLNTSLKRMFQATACTFHAQTQDQLPRQHQSSPPHVISALLQSRYPFVPPVGGVDKMRSNHTTGTKIIAFAATQLFSGSFTLSSVPREKSYTTVLDDVFCRSWKLFQKTSQDYRLQEPQDDKVRSAWDLISERTDLNGRRERKILLKDLWAELSKEPYGYDYFTFTMLLSGWLAYHRREVLLVGANKVSLKKGERASIVTQTLKEWARTEILSKPKTFVEDWINKGTSTKLIRRESLTIPVIPASPIPFDKAQRYLEQAKEFLSSNETEDSERETVDRDCQSVQLEMDKIQQWFAPVETAEQLANTATMTDLIRTYGNLFESPPDLDLSGKISVRPSKAQRDRKQAVQTSIGERLEAEIQHLCERSQTLPDVETCQTYQQKVQAILDQLLQTPHCPPHFSDELQKALQAAQHIEQLIAEQAQIQQKLEQVQALIRQLNGSFTQQQYHQTHAELEQRLNEIPEATEQGQEARQQVQNLELAYNQLNQQLDAWEERETSVVSQNAVLELIRDISAQEQRFTEDSDRQRIQVLERKLDQKIHSAEAQDNEAKLLQQELATTLATAQQKLQRLRDLPVSKIIDIIQVYQELNDITFNDTLPSSDAVDQAHQQLQDFKVRGRSSLENRIQEICDRKVTSLKECQQVETVLQQAQQRLADWQDFAPEQETIKTALQAIGDRRNEIEQQQRDRKAKEADAKTMQMLRHYKSDHIKTLAMCEEGLTKLATLQGELYQPDLYAAELDQIQQSLQSKIHQYQEALNSLGDRLVAVSTLAQVRSLQSEYVGLKIAFENSAHTENYEAIGYHLQTLHTDLEQIEQLQQQYQTSNSMLACQELLNQLGDEAVSLQDLNRFRPQLSQLEQNLQSRIQAYWQGLTALEQQLSYASTITEAQAVQTEIVKKSSYYTNSDAEAQYQRLLSETSLLIEVLQLVEAHSCRSLETCEACLDAMSDWENAHPDSSEILRDRLQIIREDINEQHQHFLAQRQSAAEAWLQRIGERAARVFRVSDDEVRFTACESLDTIIQRDRSTHFSVLESKHQNSVIYIEQKCREEQQKNQARQIIISFRQLPRLQRQQLYEQLAQYLNESDNQAGE